MKWIKISIYFLSAFAVAFSISILAFYLHASKILGHFPTYSNPDPKGLDIYEIYDPIITITFGTWFFSFVLWLILILIYVGKTQKQPTYKPIFVTSGLQFIALLILFSRIFEWYVD